MDKVPFGRTGLHVSPLGFGAAPIGYLKTDRDRVAAILNLLLDAGVNLIDTAANYEGSEEVIGEAVGHRRGEFVLVSKCGTAVAGLARRPLVGRAGLRHGGPCPAPPEDRPPGRDAPALLRPGDARSRATPWAALVKARDAGKIRFAGYSGDNDAAAYAAALPDVAVIETSVSIADQDNLDAVLPTARENNVGVLAKRPIANAAWRGVGEPARPVRQLRRPLRRPPAADGPEARRPSASPTTPAPRGWSWPCDSRSASPASTPPSSAPPTPTTPAPTSPSRPKGPLPAEVVARDPHRLPNGRPGREVGGANVSRRREARAGRPKAPPVSRDAERYAAERARSAGPCVHAMVARRGAGGKRSTARRTAPRRG